MTDQTNIFDQRSILGAQIRQASGANPFDSVTVDPNANLIEIRLSPAESVAFSAYLDAADRWRTAFEDLHARLLRDLPGDGSELPPPGDEYWARTLDDLLTFAAETAHAAERGA